MNLNMKLKTICSEFFKQNIKRIKSEQDQIYYTISYFIHATPHLSMLFLQWTNLNVYQKYLLNIQVNQSLIKRCKTVYPPIICAFEYWERIQDTCGAPGFSCNPLTTELSEEMDKNIANTMYIIDRTINQIEKKNNVMKELSAYKDPKAILYSYKWRIFCKNMYRKRSYLTHSNDQKNQTENRNDEDYMTDLNGSGDITWYSESE